MSRPKCPNHTCEMDPTNEPRWWICPISHWRFECDVDTEAKDRPMVKDAEGNLKQEDTWKVIPGDGAVHG